MSTTPENIFHPATKKDHPKKRIHRTAILCHYCVIDNLFRSWETHFWITAKLRAKQAIQLSLYVGDESTNPQRRECLDTVVVSNWQQTVEWLKFLDGISGDRIDVLSNQEIKAHKAVFSKIRPSWF